uniref:Ankyrin repeat domain-containing protein n=1 Tax=Zea mays TaxID=4577 RepID=C0P931_MAIZE|nr:unknown [Zea mays]
MTRLCNNICTSVPWQTLQAANKVKAIWRLSELLTTKLPTGTFPVKVNYLAPWLHYPCFQQITSCHLFQSQCMVQSNHEKWQSVRFLQGR